LDFFQSVVLPLKPFKPSLYTCPAKPPPLSFAPSPFYPYLIYLLQVLSLETFMTHGDIHEHENNVFSFLPKKVQFKFLIYELLVKRLNIIHQ